MTQQKQYQPSEILKEKIQGFINGVKALDSRVQFQFEQTDRDVIITVVSPMFGQMSQYAVWDIYKNKLTGEVDGSTLRVQRFA